MERRKAIIYIQVNMQKYAFCEKLHEKLTVFHMAT